MKKILMIFLGPPGSGKGTQADYFSERLGVPLISVGALFRQEIAQDTDIGRLVERKIANGKLVKTEITNQILDKRLEKPDTDKGFILDGYPRKKNQIKYVLNKIREFRSERGGVFIFYIDVSDKVAKERIGGRRSCSCGENFHIKYRPPKKEGICDACGNKLKQRADDSEESVERRFVEFHRSNDPVLEFFKDKEYFHEINGGQSIEEVKKNIKKIFPNN